MGSSCFSFYPILCSEITNCSRVWKLVNILDVNFVFKCFGIFNAFLSILLYSFSLIRCLLAKHPKVHWFSCCSVNLRFPYGVWHFFLSPSVIYKIWSYKGLKRSSSKFCSKYIKKSNFIFLRILWVENRVIGLFGAWTEE